MTITGPFKFLLKNVFASASPPNEGNNGLPSFQSEDSLRCILEGSPDGMYRRDLRSDRCDLVNPALEKITGIAAGSFAALDLAGLVDLMHPQDRDRVREAYAEALESGGASGALEYRLPAGCGYRWISERFSITRDARGEPCHLVGTLRESLREREEAPERGEAAAAGAGSDEILRSFMELMPVGVALLGLDGRFLFLNRFFQETYGYDLADLPTVEQWFQKAYPDSEYRAKVITVFRTEPGQTLPNGAPVPPRETLVTCKDGSVRHVVFNRQLTPNYRIIILTDITEREKLYSEILKLQKLESLGTLAGGIAHDFNNILTAIIGNLSLARLLFDAQDWSSELLEDAQAESERAAKLAAQLLTFAQGGAPVKKLVAPGEILKDAVSLVLAGSRVQADWQLAEPLNAVEADPAQLSQACHNLVLNALEAMPDGGTLTVTAENLALGSGDGTGVAAGNYLRITLSEQGSGLPLEVPGTVPAARLSTGEGAVGPGLVAAESIVTRHGGNLSVHSQAGRGTRVTVILPSTGAPLPEPAQVRRHSSVSFSAGDTILLMDDEQSIRNIACKMLECLSYRVTTCRDGATAVELFQQARQAGTPYRSVILDLKVAGGMDGEEAARRILAIDPGACLIASSAYANNPVFADFKRFGFRAVMPKPYRLSDIEAVLAEVH